MTSTNNVKVDVCSRYKLNICLCTQVTLKLYHTLIAHLFRRSFLRNFTQLFSTQFRNYRTDSFTLTFDLHVGHISVAIFYEISKCGFPEAKWAYGDVPLHAVRVTRNKHKFERFSFLSFPAENP